MNLSPITSRETFKVIIHSAMRDAFKKTYEPPLTTMLSTNHHEGKLRPISNPKSAIRNAT